MKMPENKEITEQKKTVSELEEELRMLRDQVAESERKNAELAEFVSLFPDVPPESVPEDIMSSKLPLAAAYALYDRRATLERVAAESANTSNSCKSAGNISGGGDSDCDFTIGEMRSMTPDEVHRNYARIIRSLGKHR